MANDFSGDANAVALYNFEVAVGADGISSNTMTAFGIVQTGAHREGEYGAACVAHSYRLYRADADLAAGFPGKSGTSSRTFSICGWQYVANTTAYTQYCVSKWGQTSDQRGYLVAVDVDDHFVLQIGYNSGASAETAVHTGVTVTGGQWYHYGVTHDDAGAWRIRVWDEDGAAVSESTGTMTETMSIEDATFNIFGGSDNTNGCIGWADEIVIFDDVLTPAEIDAIRLGAYPPPAVPTAATDPSPADEATEVDVATEMSWTDGGGAVTFDVYLSTDDTIAAGDLVSDDQAAASYDPPTNLLAGTTYYWRIDSTNGGGTTTGTVWSFTTRIQPAVVYFSTPTGTTTAVQGILASLPAHWPVSERLEWNTGILTAADGSEQRLARRRPPRQMITYEWVCRDRTQSQILETILHRWLHRSWFVPIWPEAERRAAALTAGATEIAIDTRYADFRAASRAVVYSDPDHAEVVRIASKTDDALTIAPALAGTYPNGQWVMPCRLGYPIAPAIRQRYTGGGALVELTYAVTDNTIVTGHTAALSYGGYEVVTDPAWLTEEVFGERYDGGVTIVDSGLGNLKLAPGSRHFNIVTQDYGRRHADKAAAWATRQWLHAINGRQTAFLVPTFQADFLLTRAVAPADVTIYVANRGRAARMGVNALRTYLAFRPVDATLIPRQITGMATISTSEETMTLAAAPGAAFAAGTTLCWVDLCRLASDTAEFQWHAPGRSLCDLPLVRVTQ